MPLVGKTKMEMMSLLRSYGSAEERMMASSTKLLELTLADALNVVNDDNPEFKLMDLRCLRRLTTVQGATISWWLSDELLRSYMLLINDKAHELSLNVHCFNSFFFSTFAEQGYKGVRRWSASVCEIKSPNHFLAGETGSSNQLGQHSLDIYCRQLAVQNNTLLRLSSCLSINGNGLYGTISPVRLIFLEVIIFCC